MSIVASSEWVGK